MTKEELHKLIEKYLTNTASSEEVKRVDDWYASFDSAQGLTNQSDKEKAAQDSFLLVKHALKLQ